MDYQQYKKYMAKVDRMMELMQKVESIEEVIAKLATSFENSLEEINGALLRIESIVEAYVERRIKDLED